MKASNKIIEEDYDKIAELVRGILWELNVDLQMGGLLITIFFSFFSGRILIFEQNHPGCYYLLWDRRPHQFQIAETSLSLSRTDYRRHQSFVRGAVHVAIIASILRQ